MKNQNTMARTAAMSFSLLLAACGGGGSSHQTTRLSPLTLHDLPPSALMEAPDGAKTRRPLSGR